MTRNILTALKEWEGENTYIFPKGRFAQWIHEVQRSYGCVSNKYKLRISYFLNMSLTVLSNQDTVYCITITTGSGDDRWEIILTSDGICGIPEVWMQTSFFQTWNRTRCFYVESII